MNSMDTFPPATFRTLVFVISSGGEDAFAEAKTEVAKSPATAARRVIERMVVRICCSDNAWNLQHN